MLPLMKIREFLIRKKNRMLSWLRSMVRLYLQSVKTVKKEEKIHASFAVTSQIAKVTATVHETCSANLEEA